MSIEMESSAGEHIQTACERAVKLANEKQASVTFTFNDTPVVAHPGDTATALVSKWSADSEAVSKAYRESPEYKERVKRVAEELERKRSARMACGAHTEKEMRETEVPWPLTMAQLTEYIESLTNRGHDYGTCCYAMSLAATAAFYFVAGQLGVTGFQSGCADLDFLRRTRHIKGPFMILKAEDALYPQYDLHGKVDEMLTDAKDWLKEEAKKKLKEKGHAAPEVVCHWKMLAVSGCQT